MRLPNLSQSVERKTIAAAWRKGVNPQVHHGCLSPVPGAAARLQQTHYQGSSDKRWSLPSMVYWPWCYNIPEDWHVCSFYELLAFL
jgi:hypothetical protein